MKLKTRAYILILIVLLQNISVIVLSNKSLTDLLSNDFNSYNYPFIVFVLINILALAGSISIYYIVKLLQKEKENIIKLNHSKEVITALQGQKHDFKNHLNVVAGMLQLDKKEKALEYIFNISERVEEVFSISIIKNIEIAATLLRKCAIAENKGIYVDIDIRSDLQYLRISSVEACKILFNLIDNAIYELDQCNLEDKYLMIDIVEVDNEYMISIGNSYPVLPPDLYDKVFEGGFTTKGDESERGYGLNIVKRMVEKNHGRITFESFEGIGTVFSVRLPMKESECVAEYRSGSKATSINEESIY